MAAFIVKTFKDVVDSIVEELKLSPDDTPEIERIKRDINMVYNNVASAPGARWNWLSRHKQIEFKPYLANGTVSVTPDSTTIEFSVAPATSKKGYMFAVDNFSEIYFIESHTAGATTATLGTPWTGQLYTAVAYKVWTDSVILPIDCQETQEVYHQFSNQPLEGVGLQEFRRRVALDPKRQGRPEFYCTYDYEDPTDNDGETETDRYLVMRVHPSIYQNSTTLNVDYVREVLALELDSDEPMMPVTDRSVLVYGGLEKAWKRFRNTEAGEQSKRDYQEKLAQMQGRVTDSQDKPQITPDSQYLARKRGRAPSRQIASVSNAGSYTAPSYLKNPVIEGAQITANVTVNPGITIDGVDISALNSQVQNHVDATTDAHDASAISVIPASGIVATNVQNALQELSSEIAAASTASGVSVTPSGNLASTNVQDALVELQGDIDTINAADYVNTLNTLEGDLTIVGGTGITVTDNGINQITVAVTASVGDVDGPASSTDNALARFDGTTGKLIQNSSAILSDAGALSGLTGLTTSGTTTLDTGLTGVVKAASGVISASALVNADVDAAASIAYSKLNLSGSIVNADVNASAAIAYSKLNLSSSIVNADVAAAAAIARSKLASGTANHVLINDGSGVMSSEAALDETRGGTAQTTYTTGDLLYASASNTLSKLAIGSANTVLTVSGGVPVWSTASSFVAPTVQVFTSGSGTYTTPTSPRTPLFLKVTVLGGGGGGGASGTASFGGASAGGNSTFGTSLITCNGGSAGGQSGNAAGGTATVNSPAILIGGLSGGAGSGAGFNSTSTANIPGGGGGESMFGAAGAGGAYTTAGGTAGSSSGSGGGGGGGAGFTSFYSGGGGGAGGGAVAIITSPSSTYSYTVGSGGSGGTAGTNGYAGGNGGAGWIIVEEYYQ